MTSQIDKAELFRSLHTPHDPLILYNIWDAGSAKAVAAAGAKAIATGSWSVAAAQGYQDGEDSLLMTRWRWWQGSRAASIFQSQWISRVAMLLIRKRSARTSAVCWRLASSV